MEQVRVRTSRAILIDGDLETGPLERMRLQDQGYVVALVKDIEAAAISASTTPPAVIFLRAESGQPQTSRLIQALKTNDSTRHIPIQLLGTPIGTRPAPKGLNSVARSNWQ
jgi:DNA-binding response OmpR family regulator